jgi:hypothetical protein
MNEKEIAEKVYRELLIKPIKPKLKNRPVGLKYDKRKNNS